MWGLIDHHMLCTPVRFEESLPARLPSRRRERLLFVCGVDVRSQRLNEGATPVCVWCGCQVATAVLSDVGKSPETRRKVHRALGVSPLSAGGASVRSRPWRSPPRWMSLFRGRQQLLETKHRSCFVCGRRVKTFGRPGARIQFGWRASPVCFCEVEDRLGGNDPVLPALLIPERKPAEQQPCR